MTHVPGQEASITPSPTPQEVSHWNVPYRRNFFFTGREDILIQLRDTFLSEVTAVALAQPQAISGLGGIGKTQTAVEYAYRYRDNYQFIATLQITRPSSGNYQEIDETLIVVYVELSTPVGPTA